MSLMNRGDSGDDCCCDDVEEGREVRSMHPTRSPAIDCGSLPLLLVLLLLLVLVLLLV